ncbi:uncharacterized protein LOC134205353 isoform X2 [Armigeres subalbatus]|uniref:uncharacterized protein LOC134205353 isoform X2 n=1 Tax=Armigeres subalbatus TaxID=124917 RepID=UPI002ED48BF5
MMPSINLSGRIVSAHRRQIKIPKDSRRRRSQRFVFSGESPSISAQLCNSNNSSFEEGTYGGSESHSMKRKRSEEDDTDSDFYGFAADSLLFEEDQDPLWNPLPSRDGEGLGYTQTVGTSASQASESALVPEGNVNCRRSKRKTQEESRL